MPHKTSLAIANAASETGPLLQEYLENRGVFDRHSEATVCYGQPATRPGPTLNAACHLSKMARIAIMHEAGVNLVPFGFADDGAEFLASQLQFPLFARKAHGMGGKDLMPVFQPEEIEWRIAAGWDWFSSYVPVARELRVWIFRDAILDVYEKVMERPEEYLKMGRNFGQGFEFKRLPLLDAPFDAVVQAHKAVGALSLDFGAVDLLIGKDGKVYILEVNTAPGVIRSGAQATLRALADHITDWVNSGYPVAA